MPKKIFELAKELDLKPLDLVEKLKAEGFSVRNHMTSLADEEVAKALELLKPAEEEKPKKKTKKKVVKKKVVKKKVIKKTAASEETASSDSSPAEPESAEEVQAADDSKVKTVVRRKVTRKKAASKEAEETPNESSGTQPEEQPAETSGEDSSEELGLRVVSRPEAEKEEVKKVETTEEKTLYKEKVHKFTPVFIPEASEETEKESSEGGAPSASGDSDDKETGTSKKRIGGLASMISGKKASVSKSQLLNQDRADNELKSYSALSLTGRPLYTQVKRKKVYQGSTKDTEITEVKESKRIVKLHDGATVDQLAKKLKVKLKEMAAKALELNLLIKTGDYVGMKLAEKIAELYDYRVENIAFDESKVLGGEDVDREKLPHRNPIIAIMGHVDHGKTTLLDSIRNAKVAAGEAGGITQHIGAYSVEVNDKTISFLDTPGHAAFASMRQRGADVTDIVVLVVAADDGVMPQTKESIRFCQQANVPIVVAVNKMDKEGVNPDRVKQELTEVGITPEDWGGETQFVGVSALKGEGLDELLEAILLQAEILDLRADPKGKAEGVVIESRIEAGRGSVATVLVQSGTLKKGDSVVVGETYGRARSLTDHLGKDLKAAGPSMPVQILGLQEAPPPGEILNTVKNEREAKKIAANRIDQRKKLEVTETRQAAASVSLEDFFSQAAPEGEKKDLNLIIRSDVQGSFEAIKESLMALSNSEVTVKVIGGGVGAINDSDVNLAISSSAIIIGFNMRPNNTARRLAEDKGIEVKTYSVIYELINDVTLALEGLLEPDYIEEFIGRAEVRDTFNIPKIGAIAGSAVVDGKIAVGCNIRLLRDGKIMFDGKLSSLKRFKDDVKEVKNGFECGIGLEGYNDVKKGDIFEAYIMKEQKRKLEDVVSADEAAANASASEETLGQA